MRESCSAGLRIVREHCELEAKCASESSDSLGRLIADLKQAQTPE